MSRSKTRRAAILGGNRIPFARRDRRVRARRRTRTCSPPRSTASSAASASRASALGEVVAGAVLKHSRDFNLTRESVLGSALAPETPAYDVQQACGTGLEATILVANKIALGQIECGDRRRRRHDQRRADRAQRRPAPRAARAQPRQALPAARQAARPSCGPGQIVPAIPRNAEPRTGLSMGEHQAISTSAGGSPRGAGRARRREPPQPRRRLRPRLLRRPGHALPRARPRREPARPTRASRSWPS